MLKGNFDRRHAAVMGITAFNVRDIIRDIEERAAVKRLTLAGNDQAVVDMVNRAAATMNQRMWQVRNQRVMEAIS